MSLMSSDNKEVGSNEEHVSLYQLTSMRFLN